MSQNLCGHTTGKMEEGINTEKTDRSREGRPGIQSLRCPTPILAALSVIQPPTTTTAATTDMPTPRGLLLQNVPSRAVSWTQLGRLALEASESVKSDSPLNTADVHHWYPSWCLTTHSCLGKDHITPRTISNHPPHAVSLFLLYLTITWQYSKSSEVQTVCSYMLTAISSQQNVCHRSN